MQLNYIKRGPYITEDDLPIWRKIHLWSLIGLMVYLAVFGTVVYWRMQASEPPLGDKVVESIGSAIFGFAIGFMLLSRYGLMTLVVRVIMRLGDIPVLGPIAKPAAVAIYTLVLGSISVIVWGALIESIAVGPSSALVGFFLITFTVLVTYFFPIVFGKGYYAINKADDLAHNINAWNRIATSSMGSFGGDALLIETVFSSGERRAVVLGRSVFTKRSQKISIYKGGFLTEGSLVVIDEHAIAQYVFSPQEVRVLDSLASSEGLRVGVFESFMEWVLRKVKNDPAPVSAGSFANGVHHAGYKNPWEI